MGPNYCAPTAPVAPHWIVQSDIQIANCQDLSRWWSVFRDPTLDRLVLCAYRQSLTLREAGFRVLHPTYRRASRRKTPRRCGSCETCWSRPPNRPPPRPSSRPRRRRACRRDEAPDAAGSGQPKRREADALALEDLAVSSIESVAKSGGTNPPCGDGFGLNMRPRVETKRLQRGAKRSVLSRATPSDRLLQVFAARAK